MDGLLGAELLDEAAGLKAYIDKGPSAEYVLMKASWAGRRCIVGATPPSTAEPGELWLDLAEMTMMVLIPGHDKNDPRKRSWLSTHPAYQWQFTGFQALARWRVSQKYFLKASDLMSTTERFMLTPETRHVSNIYHEEAVGYARWFGKMLCSQSTLQLARSFLPPECCTEVLPKDFRLWSEMECMHSEFVRIAIGQSSLDSDPDDQFEERRENKENEALGDRMLFEEWERRPEIGLATCIPLQDGLVHQAPARAYEFMELTSLAPRH